MDTDRLGLALARYKGFTKGTRAAMYPALTEQMRAIEKSEDPVYELRSFLQQLREDVGEKHAKFRSYAVQTQ